MPTTTCDTIPIPSDAEGYAPEVVQAAQEYRALRDRRTNPVGSFDKAGRWYPDSPCSCRVRYPSRAFPYSLLLHHRTAEHVAAVHGVARRDVLHVARLLDKAGA